MRVTQQLQMRLLMLCLVIDQAAPTIAVLHRLQQTETTAWVITIDIVATMTAGDFIVKGSSITVTLDASSTATAVLTADANGNTMTGSYTVRAGDNSSDLSVASFVQTSPVTDIYGNVMTSSSLPSTNIADGSALVVDGGAPTSTKSAIEHDSSNHTITLAGTDFDTIDSATTDVKSQLDWTKFTWDIDGDGATTAGLQFEAADIASAEKTSATQFDNNIRTQLVRQKSPMLLPQVLVRMRLVQMMRMQLIM